MFLFSARVFFSCSRSFFLSSLFFMLTSAATLLSNRLGVKRRYVQWDTRAHCRAQRCALHILAFGRGRLGFENGLNQTVGIFEQLGGGETDLADWRVNDARFIDAEFHFTGF